MSFLLTNCSTQEDQAIEVVDNFLNQANDEIEGNLDTTKIIKPINDLIKSHNGFSSKDGWTLSAFKKNDTTVIVESVGKTHNMFGQPMEIKQKFALKKINNEWIIYDTYNVIRLFLGMDIVDKDWAFFLDMEKQEIITELQKSLKLEVVKKGFRTTYTEAAKGELILINKLMGNASEVSSEKLHEKYGRLLIEGEKIELGFKLIRDVFMFTDRRLILIDVQGLTQAGADLRSVSGSFHRKA